MNNLHIILYSSFPKYSGGRENWLINILPGISGAFNKIFLYVYKSDRATFYDLSPFTNVVLKEVSGLRKKDLLFYILNFISFKLLFLWDSLFIFRKQVGILLRRELKPGDTVLATNSIIEMQPAVDVISELNNIRLVCIAHGLVPVELGNYIPYCRKKFELMEKRLLPLCDVVLANGYDTQEYLNKHDIDSVVVPNGVNVARFQTPDLTGKELDIIKDLKANHYRIILMVATLRKIKGIDDLLMAGKLLKDMGMNKHKLVFVGKGNVTPFKNKARKFKIEENVIFMGEQKNIPGLLSLADIVVCTFGGSGMTLATLEAMASCRPIVAWDTIMYTQLLTHMEDSYLAKHADHHDLAKGIKMLLDDSVLGEKFSKQLVGKAQKFDWNVVTKELLQYL